MPVLQFMSILAIAILLLGLSVVTSVAWRMNDRHVAFVIYPIFIVVALILLFCGIAFSWEMVVWPPALGGWVALVAIITLMALLIDHYWLRWRVDREEILHAILVWNCIGLVLCLWAAS